MNSYRVLVGKAEGKRPLGRNICRWEVNIEMDLREILWSGMYLIHIAQDREQRLVLANMVMNTRYA
jgi:hypothetical protein